MESRTWCTAGRSSSPARRSSGSSRIWATPCVHPHILGVWKLLGAVVIVAPGLPRLKEWAYAGVFFELSGAAASYVLHGEITSDLAAPLILAALAMISWALRPEGRVLGVLFPVRTNAHVALNATTRG